MFLVVDGLLVGSFRLYGSWGSATCGLVNNGFTNTVGSSCFPSASVGCGFPGYCCISNHQVACNCDDVSAFAPFHGQISIIRYYQTAFSAVEVLALYGDTTGSSFCLPGQFANNSCFNCSAGFFRGAISSLSMKTTCSPCAAGYFSNSGADVCSPCAAGSYQPQAGQASCLPAPPGFYQPNRAQTTSIPCPPGQYSPSGYVGTSVPCILCPVGSWAGQLLSLFVSEVS